MTWLLLALQAWLLLAVGLLLAWRKSLRALWREPMFRVPILILESDDWGAGPSVQAEALTAIAACLARHRDQGGRSAVMTLALVLAIPEPGMASGSPWRRRSLSNLELQPVRDAIHNGEVRGVFALQLHGMEHFWPESLLTAAAGSHEVRVWLDNPELTETLPSPLQSRWTNAVVLPSRYLSTTAIHAAVAEETAAYTEIIGAPPEVAVPPTFVWNQEVEAAWADAGVKVIITPGQRHTCRDSSGRPAGVDRDMRNGERGAGDVLYLVRDEYFEPLFGHRPEQALTALAAKTARGRPCLLETHRWNFLAATGGNLTTALAAMDKLYTQALQQYPGLRFTSCAELGRAIRYNDSAWIEQDTRSRFTIWLRRVADIPRFGNLARIIGLFALLNLFARSPYP